MITVLKPGVYTTIQDLGRPGFAHIGVPVSGVMDSYSAKIGNQILKNELHDAVVEITFGGCQFQFNKDAWICITGADFYPTIKGNRLLMNTLIKVEKGTVLIFEKRVQGIRTYLCIKGGILSETVLKSKSFYKGVTSNFILKKGDKLAFRTATTEINETHSKVKIDATHFTSKSMVCTKGPEFDLLTEKEQTILIKSPFTISNDNNRVGYRLEEKLNTKLKAILTSGVLPGTVQLTPSGTLIVLMRDCQVTGGYPRVLQLSEMAINQLAQKTTGNQFWFDLKSF